MALDLWIIVNNKRTLQEKTRLQYKDNVRFFETEEEAQKVCDKENETYRKYVPIIETVNENHEALGFPKGDSIVEYFRKEGEYRVAHITEFYDLRLRRAWDGLYFNFKPKKPLFC